ncbi:lactate dehydrogenase [Oscillibacter sp. MSJ-2]|uniref:Lactate dehydrogenase n=1 Tax=Dysosmobacter acutus TaxID=2841504 RepID=A0ABS6FD65_9FIRM|nr:lactate dehydrogenase [Dysosmobacter acutus]MBU5628092.1 lactate dehydrogenase [Dysosmobacter acutus]
MVYYRQNGSFYCAFEEDLPLPRVEPPEEGVPMAFLFRRDPLSCRASFSATDPRQLIADQGLGFLDLSRLGPAPEIPGPAARRMADGTLRAVNFDHPRWRFAAEAGRAGKRRLHILALGDVGSTLLTALKLLGADVLSTIGICDLNEKTTRRWEFEMNQVAYPWDYGTLPEVEVVDQEHIFDCDVFVFVATRGIPPVGSGVQDVRMAQFEANRGLVEHFARRARVAKFRGLFAVVSDPVDPLARAALLESNRGEDGLLDGRGLLPEQIQGYGLGVMNARAAYYAKKDPRFASFLTEGRAFGPHGEDLVIANSIAGYDDALSRELTHLTVTANLKMREMGFKPYVAPALSSAAISLLLTLRGEWHYGSVYLDGVYLGVKNRYTPFGQEVESLPLPEQLFQRISIAAEHLKNVI